ncbi:hypothetical protein [Rubidibacter lacunae]|uniref:hypothetical protein n=1 Tax=Rubidibacter lacunae TaxID=582514 RepID=UPI00058B6C82|nr:hypothetical protein [Rubidibacter lacunae]
MLSFSKNAFSLIRVRSPRVGVVPDVLVIGVKIVVSVVALAAQAAHWNGDDGVEERERYAGGDVRLRVGPDERLPDASLEERDGRLRLKEPQGDRMRLVFAQAARPKSKCQERS